MSKVAYTPPRITVFTKNGEWFVKTTGSLIQGIKLEMWREGMKRKYCKP